MLDGVVGVSGAPARSGVMPLSFTEFLPFPPLTVGLVDLGPDTGVAGGPGSGLRSFCS